MSTNPPSWGPGDGMTPPPVPPPPNYGAPPAYYPPPGYGYATAPPAKRPPKKLWLGIGAVLFVLGLIGVGLGVSLVVKVMNSPPTAEHTFTAGESTTVHIDAGASKLIFATTGAAQHNLHCDVTSADGIGGVEITQYDGSFTLNQWTAIFTVHVKQASDYTITCSGQPGDTFGVADDVGVGSLVLGIVCIVGGGGLAILGVIVVIIAAVLRARRRTAVAHEGGSPSWDR
jgi:hypothetical protein